MPFIRYSYGQKFDPNTYQELTLSVYRFSTDIYSVESSYAANRDQIFVIRNVSALQSQTENLLAVPAAFYIDFSDNIGQVGISTFNQNDIIYGGSGNDNLLGRDGNDLIEGGLGRDAINGGVGNNTVSYESSATAVTVDLSTDFGSGGASDGDFFGGSIQNVRGSAMDDTLTGYSNDNILEGGRGADRIEGARGIDTASYEHSSQGVTVDLTLGSDPQTGAGDADGDILTGIENVRGSALADSLTGDGNANDLKGGEGIDILDGRDGADHVFGQGGNDDLTGGAGNDRLDGGAGDDAMTGGDGNDTYFIDSEDDAVHDTGIGTDTVYVSAENFTLGDGEQIETLRVYGNGISIAGNDVANTIVGGASGDMLDGAGAADRLFGQIGGDALDGGAGNDRLDGGAGDDAIMGGTGLDQMFGGAGTDTFKFLSVSDSAVGGARDVINDFSRGLDLIDLSEIDADTMAGGVQTFAFIGSGTFTKQAGQLHYKATGTNAVLVEADVNGDGEADFQITVRGVSSLQESDFLL